MDVKKTDIEVPTILWFDARIRKSDSNLYSSLVKTHNCIYYGTEIFNFNPSSFADNPIIIFDFDYASTSWLALLKSIRQNHRKIPVLLLVEQKIEMLAIFALRYRVWDILYKPLEFELLKTRLKTLANRYDQLKRESEWYADLIETTVPNLSITRYIATHPNRAKHNSNCNKRNHRSSNKGCCTDEAVAYINDYFSEKITEKYLARLCNLSCTEFSRRFKKEQGNTFQIYLLEKRLECAKQLLKATDSSITEIAFSVGFNESSYFTRMYARRYNITPKQYRNNFFRRD